MGNRKSLITLITDFGEQDYFVGAMKGVILSINPEAKIVDISHLTPPQDVEAAAFNLLNCYKDFPAGTIHVAVVDPGVGSDRRAIAIDAEKASRGSVRRGRGGRRRRGDERESAV